VRPLKDVENFALAISERDFRLVNTIPAAREVRCVVRAIKFMSAKLLAMNDHVVQQAMRFRYESNKEVPTNLENRRGFVEKE
jgi:hypothetical protein